MEIKNVARAAWDKTKSVRNGISLMFLLCLIAHLVDAFRWKFSVGLVSYRLALWAFIWLIGWLVIKEYQLDFYSLGISLMLSLFSFGVPYLKHWLDLGLPSAWGNMMVVFAPIWLVYIAYVYQDSPEWIKTAGTFYLVFWLFIAIVYGFQSGFLQKVTGLQAGQIDVWTPVKTVWKLFVDGYKSAKQALKDYGKKLNASQQKFMSNALGDAYTGQVDQNSKEKLGVFLQDIHTSQSEYYTGDPVGIWATISARTLDKPISINIGCFSDMKTKNQRKADKVIPNSRYDVYMTDDSDLDCSFDGNTMQKGPHKITLQVNFSFYTLGYQKVYFVDKSRALALQKDSTDILDYYKITDKKPVAVYTNGPLMLGMQVSNTPIKLDRQAGNQVFMLGVTLKNQWDGQVSNITGLRLRMPTFAKLEGSKCSGYDFESTEAGLYTLRKGIGTIKDYVTIRCPISIINVDQALGNTPVSIQYFKIETNYTYVFEKTVGITIKQTADELNQLEYTKKSSPKFYGIENRAIAKGDSFEISLPNQATDAETPKEKLTFKIISQTSPDVAECLLGTNNNLVCTAQGKDGFTEILLEVSDGSLTNTTKFRITVGNVQTAPTTPSSSSTTSTAQTTSTTPTTPTSMSIDCNNAYYLTYCETTTSNEKKAFNAKGDCVSLCELYQGCKFGIDTSWSCSCNPGECDAMGANCQKGLCPGAQECCKFTVSLP